MNWIFGILNKLSEDKFTGYFQINFLNGIPISAHKHETIKP